MNLSAVAPAGIISALVMMVMYFAIAVKMGTILDTLQISQRFVRNGRRMMENDYIGRREAIKAIQQAVIKGYNTDYGLIDSDVVYEILDDLPAADVVPVVHGEWIKYTGMGKVQWMCSKCSAEEKNPKVANYCYHCGAKM